MVVDDGYREQNFKKCFCAFPSSMLPKYISLIFTQLTVGTSSQGPDSRKSLCVGNVLTLGEVNATGDPFCSIQGGSSPWRCFG